MTAPPERTFGLRAGLISHGVVPLSLESFSGLNLPSLVEFIVPITTPSTREAKLPFSFGGRRVVRP
jgi:hypothetical protein